MSKKKKLLQDDSLNEVENKKKNKMSFFHLKGLTNQEAEIRFVQEQKKYTPNIDNNIKIKDIIFNNLFTFFNLLLLIVTIIIITIKQYKHLIFLFINSLNLLINIIQEIKAKKILDKISLLTLNNTKVIRNGHLIEVPIKKIVCGDILFLESGSQITADAYLKEGLLEVNESMLTGESKLIFKKKGDFLYSGSYVVSGHGSAEVTATGINMYISKLTLEAKKYKKIQTPLTKHLSYLILTIIYILIPTTLALFFCSLKEYSFNSLASNEFILGLCGFVLGSLPSGLFLLTTLMLTVGFIKLSRQKAYMKDLFGIEMLAQIDVLCLDKTGTITDGTMKVEEVAEYSKKNLISPQLMSQLVGAFPNNNATQKALYDKFALKNLIFEPSKIINSQSFSSLRKYSAVQFEKEGTFILGAPEFILQKQFIQIKKDVEIKTKLGYRAILLAQTEKPLDCINEQTNFEIISLIYLKEHLKEDAFATLEYFRQNNIKIKIISGDNQNTIAYIAKKLKIIKNPQKIINLTNIYDKQEITKLSMAYDVFGRVTPEQKKMILQGLKQNNLKIAMIGDGVNDILAFKEADISIAMASGSKATQKIANLVMLDSKFSALPQVVAEGRRIINNLKKISVLFLVKTMSVFGLALINLFINCFASTKHPFPLQPFQINLMDAFFIGVPSFWLSLEANNQKIKNNFLKSVLKRTFPFALLISFNYLFLFCCENLPISLLLNILSALTFFYLLIDNCEPFNKWKMLLVHLMFGSFIFTFWFLELRDKSELILSALQNQQFLVLLLINIIFFVVYFFKKKINFVQKI
ncbi:HAD-IC family P-type ATPase [Candidatus Phytoplasma phoenicium]|uniref:Cation transport ATPase n=1 Tax=Candidatus Phytoplasma phoenicium TaxID=198422 RepID=A0A0L0MJT5_9MOLU|nr:HAD-IC family P-type ATPase [Candidatus Phytoplasma phoenicium]KND62555.1 Cation transport ATPase [Candidatus Phytoplasma phoenicium]